MLLKLIIENIRGGHNKKKANAKRTLTKTLSIKH